MHDLREGMRVVDSDGKAIGKAIGKEIGNVEDFKMGDPAVTTAAGESDIAPSDFFDVYGRQDEVSPHLARRPLRIGFVGIDRNDLSCHNQMVASVQLDRGDDGKLVLKPDYKAATT